MDNRAYMYDQIDRSPDLDGENNFRSYYPNGRYSKFIHSPVRLRRELEPNYLDTHVKINPNGVYGEIKRAEPKFPGNRFIDSENRYHTGYIVGMEDYDDDEYPELRPADKKKREVEISIKSDGKLVKRIEEDENGPKSIILNIKAGDSNDKSQILGYTVSTRDELSNVVSTVVASDTISVEQTQINRNIDIGGPSNSKTIPSMINTNNNQKGAQKKNIGIPINSIPASNSAFSNNKNAPSPVSQIDESNNALNAKNIKQSINPDKFTNIKNYNLPEVSKVSNNIEGVRQKIDSYKAKLLGGDNRQQTNNLENSRWSENNNQIANSIDIAQNNVNDKPILETDPNEQKKESEFEKVQGLVIDSTMINDNSVKENKEKYANKRRSVKEKRWDEMENDQVQSNIPLSFEQSEGTTYAGFDYAGSLEQEALDVNNADFGNQNPDHIHWETGNNGIDLDHNEKYEIIEQSTKKIIILPLSEMTTPCDTNLHIPGETDLNRNEKEKEANDLRDEVAQELEREKEAKIEKEYEESTECAHEHAPKHHEEEEEEEKKEEEVQILHEKDKEDEQTKHESHKDKEHEHCKHEYNKESNENPEEGEIVHKHPIQTHHHGHENHQSHERNERKRQIVKKKKPKYVVKKNKNLQSVRGQYYGQIVNLSKRELENNNYIENDAYRNRKHMPPVPKYKKKRVRQHSKKRIDRVDTPALVDYYNLNEFYGSPDDTFDFIPSYYKRKLKSVNYEFDPDLIHDVGNHEEEEIKEFEKAQKENKKIESGKKDQKKEKLHNSQGYRKKFKSEGDYSEEEESITMKSISKKIPIKKTKNEFAPNVKTTTEENDDDYNYQDLSDMEDEEEDVAYEEEKADDIEVDEQIGNSNNRSEHENDRLNLNKPSGTCLVLPQTISESTSKTYSEKSVFVEIFPYSRYTDEDEDENDNNGERVEGEEISNVHKGHGSKKKKVKKNKIKKKRPKRNNKVFINDENEDEEEEEEDEGTSVARGHGDRTKMKKLKKQKKMKKKKSKRNNGSNQIYKTNIRNLANEESSFHGRGNLGYKFIKHKKLKPKREDNEPISQKDKISVNEQMSEKFEEKPLSNQQKQDIFLRYNPEFQRWPRFVQSDNIYRDLMKRRSLENQRRYFQNAQHMDRFPISNEYFLSPQKPEFVKREEPATEKTTAASETAAVSSAATQVATTAETEYKAESGTETGATETFPEQKEQASETTPTLETESASLNSNENLSDATLPQAAKNILQTANSDIFENTTAPVLEAAESGNTSVINGGGGPGVSGESTQFQFTTNADDLTQNTQCETQKALTITQCPDESASHSPVTITSVLPLEVESATLLKVNMTKSEYLDLNEIVGGNLPRQIVSQSLSGAKGSVRQGLNSGTFNMNLNLSNYNSSAETRMILNEMTSLMLKLKYHTTCQALPVNLKTYLKLTTKNDMDDSMAKLKEMQEIDFDEHQSSYVFHTGESDSIQNKAQTLKELLNKYNNLPDNCKERAEPVREYIESHLAMIDNMSGKGSTKTPTATLAAENGTTVHPKVKKEIGKSNFGNSQEKVLDDQMMEEGLNNQKPDANEAIEDKDKKSKREAVNSNFPPIYRRELSTSTSPQYGKLADAVRKMRHRRESVKRIAEIYSRAKREEVDKVENEAQSKQDTKGFESPLVINF